MTASSTKEGVGESGWGRFHFTIYTVYINLHSRLVHLCLYVLSITFPEKKDSGNGQLATLYYELESSIYKPCRSRAAYGTGTSCVKGTHCSVYRTYGLSYEQRSVNL